MTTVVDVPQCIPQVKETTAVTMAEEEVRCATLLPHMPLARRRRVLPSGADGTIVRAVNGLTCYEAEVAGGLDLSEVDRI